jgi:hypothetical protein
MDTQIRLLSHDALDAVVGGFANNGQGNMHSHGAGAQPLTGDMGTGINSLSDGLRVAGSYVTGVATLGLAGAAATGLGSVVI